MRVLLTGAAGFVGAAVADVLRSHGHEVVPVDLLIPQAHQDFPEAEDDLQVVDVRDGPALAPLLRGVDVVCHQAAMVGAGVDPADLPAYASHNDLGTASLLSAMAAAQVHRLVLASSMVVYGEGRYRCPEHGLVAPPARPRERLDHGDFDNYCAGCGRTLAWQPVPEDARLEPRSSYAASKVAQEHYASAWARQVGGPQAGAGVVALRYHNVYGPGMPRDTPYSGVAAIFRSSLERGEPPQVFEDGAQMRDFVHVRDVAEANLRAVERVGETPGFEPFNVCSGRAVSILEVARLLATGRGPAPVVTGAYRPGDVRHVVASPERARAVLGFEARISPETGIPAFADDPLR